MMLLKKVILLIGALLGVIIGVIVTSGHSVEASTASYSQLRPLCRVGINNCNTSQKELIQKFVWNCQVQSRNSGCEDLVRKNPTWAPMMRQCDFPNMCKEMNDHLWKKDIACLRGYKNALVDTGIAIKDLTVSAVDLVADSWKNVLAHSKQREQYLSECNQSLGCKRELANSLYPNNKMTDEYLKKTSAKNLWQSKIMARDHEVVRISKIANANSPEVLRSRMEGLKHLKDIVSGGLLKQLDRHACYSDLAREELECYAIGTVVDPLLIAGYFSKGSRATVAIKEASASGRVLEKGAIPDSIRAPTSLGKRSEFTKKYLNYNPTTSAQNDKWISLAAKPESKNTLFLDIENSQLKNLNDTLKDKNLVTSLTNYHKEITFDMIRELQKRNLGLKVDMYSDFKASRFAFSGKIPGDLQAQLREAFEEANGEFARVVKSSKLVRENDKAENWFRSGIGNTADQANLAARYSRQQLTNKLQTFDSPVLKSQVQLRLNAIESQRVSLQGELAKTSLLDGKSLESDVYDIIRKSEGSTNNAKETLKARYGLASLSDGTVKKIQQYVADIDEFSPGIHVSQRVVANFDNAPAGGLSADIIGMGAANSKGTADALAGVKDINKALTNARAGEKAVTLKFEAQKSYFEDVIKNSVAPGKLKTVCSGDDCVAMAVKPLEASEKQLIVSRLSNSEYSGTYRLAFVNEGISNPEVRNNLATHGESVEKILRKSLATRMEPRKLKGLTFAVDLQTKNLNQGPMKLITGKSANTKLSAQELEVIRMEFEKAIHQLNKELAREGGKNATYKVTN